LYERIPGFPGVAVNLRRTRKALEQIDDRTDERAGDPEREDPGDAVPIAQSPTPRREEPWQ
jgi:hypothetical protein